MIKTKEFYKRRTHIATAERHNGRQDRLGSPTYETDSDWITIFDDWICELLTTGGGEKLRGRVVSATTTHVFTGDYWSVQQADLTPDCRMRVDGKLYSIVKVWQPDGLNDQMWVEAKQSW